MRINLSGAGRGVYCFGNRVIDSSRVEIRKKITEEELKKFYENFLEKINEKSFAEYFGNQEAFKKTLEKLANEWPKLIPRECVYPSIFNFKYQKNSLESIFNPSKKIEDDKYFFVASISIPEVYLENSPFWRLIGASEKEKKEIIEKNKNMKAEIFIPNNRTKAETKSSIFHEASHYFLCNYQIFSNKLFTKEDADYSTDCSKIDRVVVERLANEKVTNFITDVLLEDDKEALFENRLGFYELQNPDIRAPFIIPAALATGALIAYSIFSNLWLIPLIPAPNLISNLAYNKYKNSKREELTKPREKIEFKI